jgi:histone deacetylase 1/2
LVYVDDIIVASSSQEAINALLKDLEKEFALKDLGDLHFFLRIEVKRSSDGLLLSQEKYAEDIIKRAGMSCCKSIATTMSCIEKLSAREGDMHAWPRGLHPVLQYCGSYAISYLDTS